ncbi:hypothetical protein ACFQQB_68645 [Nonomuraea rubra]|uniref:hypothetical protein n=1 Tax=Nonomuraea rubra TaxID=46180 RepID=UPI0036100A2C
MRASVRSFAQARAEPITIAASPLPPTTTAVCQSRVPSPAWASVSRIGARSSRPPVTNGRATTRASG